jgi:hypothetical protein
VIISGGVLEALRPALRSKTPHRVQSPDRPPSSVTTAMGLDENGHKRKPRPRQVLARRGDKFWSGAQKVDIFVARGVPAMTRKDAEYFQTGMKMGRGRAQRSLDLIKAMYEIAEEGQPITGRGVGYKLFSLNLIPSMGRNDMQVVYRLLKEAREEGTIPWEWIVDETRELEQVATWDNATEYLRCTARDYRRDFWQQQQERVQVWSEKGTVRGVLQPLLDEYGVGFMPVHGFGSATIVNSVSQADDSHPLTILYIGDYDPSGLWMSERDIPDRLKRYGGDHITVERIALLRDDCTLLGRRPAFNVKEKSKDTRTPWFRKIYGQLCWELDAMDPNDLRTRVETEINYHIEPVAWERCRVVDAAERESMRRFLDEWNDGKGRS